MNESLLHNGPSPELLRLCMSHIGLRLCMLLYSSGFACESMSQFLFIEHVGLFLILLHIMQVNS